MDGQSRIGIAALAAALLYQPLPAAASSPGVGPADETAWAGMESALRQLRDGSPDAKRQIAANADWIFRPLFHVPTTRDDQDVDAIVADLRDWLRVEKDDWIAMRFLENIELSGGMDGLMLDALAGVSPNLQWAAIRACSRRLDEDAIPLLEKLWKSEERPWARAALIEALARHRSDRFLDEFISLARSDDDAIAQAAVQALGSSDDARTVPALAAIARGASSPARRIAALQAIGLRVDDDPAALAAALEASRSDDPRVRRAAVDAVGWSNSDEALARLQDVALHDEIRTIAGEAVDWIDTFDDETAIPVLIDLVRSLAHRPDDAAFAAAVDVLADSEDDSLLTQLEGLPASVRLDGLRRSLAGEDDEDLPEPPDPGPDLDEEAVDDGSVRIVVPDPGMDSARCWRYPEIPADPPGFPRLVTGLAVEVLDHYELGSESWVETRVLCGWTCWLPLRQVQSPGDRPVLEERPDSGWRKEEASMLLRREFDVPAADLESEEAKQLMDEGFLEVIEPGDDVVGVALLIDVEDFDAVLFVARLCGSRRNVLDQELYAAISELAPLYRDHPVLDRFRHTGADDGAAEDTVLDLNLATGTDR